MQGFGVEVAVDVPVGRLSIAQRQLAQIARALATPHRIVIFDEPTASLTPVETTALLRLIRELKRQGVVVLYISHRLEEVKAIADVVTVLRDGKWVATRPAETLQPVDMARLMVGRDLLDLYPPRSADADNGAGVCKSSISTRLALPPMRVSASGRARSSALPGWWGRVAANCSRRCSACARGRAKSGCAANRGIGRTRAPACAPAPSI